MNNKLDNLNRRVDSMRHKLAASQASATLALKNLNESLGAKDATLEDGKKELELLRARHAENLEKYEGMVLKLEELSRGTS